MAKIDFKLVYQERIEQIDKDLRNQYCRGKNKDKVKITALLQEKGRLQQDLGVM